MSCEKCNPIVDITYSNNPISNCNQSTTSDKDSGDIVYNGPNLTCTGVESGTKFDKLLQKFDEKICSITGDYSTYNTYCLENITTEKQFVEAISSAYCTLQDSYDDFTTNTYVNDLTTINGKIADLDKPEITSSCTTLFNPEADDTLDETLQKLSNSLCTIVNTTLDLSDVTWDSCFTVTTTPDTIQEGFSTVLSQICSLKSDMNDLDPSNITFDNTGSCLTGGTATDTLSTTIGLIKTRLCTTPTFDIDSLNWTCVTKPTTTESNNLQLAFQTVLNSLDNIKQKIPVFSSDFTTSTAGCDGLNVSLSGSLTDSKVAASSSDETPGTLEDKLAAGDNIELDYTTTAGKVTISSTGGSSSSDGKVKAYSTDDQPGYLSSKLSSSTGDDITIVFSEDTTGKTVQASADYDAKAMLTAMLDVLEALPTSDPLFQKFCALKNRCPDSCGSVTDVSVNYYPTGG